MANLHTQTDSFLVNWNSGALCAIEVVIASRTPVPKRDSIIQVCVLPLNAEIKIHKGILPFYCDVIPQRPELIQWDNLPTGVNKSRIFKVSQFGIHPFLLADRFDLWIKKFQFSHGKKILPLCYDWVQKRPFLEDWLGYEAFNQFFSYNYRDPIAFATSCNDRAELLGDQIPYPKTLLSFLGSETDSEHDTRANDALQNCITLAELYRKMLIRYNNSLLEQLPTTNIIKELSS